MKVKGPDAIGREAMYYADRQDFAYQRGSYDYLESIAMMPKLATIAGYIQALGIKKVLDIGCGTGLLLPYLDSSVAYVGVDIAPTAIERAQERYSARANTQFFTSDLRAWVPPARDFDCIIWAGIGQAWTKKGRQGSSGDWLEILQFAESCLMPNGYLVIELVTPHWPSLHALIGDRYRYIAGCDLDCFQAEESPKRSIRVFQVPTPSARAEFATRPAGPLVNRQVASRIAELGQRMGQLIDLTHANLGFGYIYYSLVRVYRPEVVVCIGSFRGFSPVCLTLGLVDNQQGNCYFIDPGKVDQHWRHPQSAANLSHTFGLEDRLHHLLKTSQAAFDAGDAPSQIDLLLIDGDHSYAGVKYDFDHFGAQVRKDGLVLLHDSTITGKGYTAWEVKQFLKAEVIGRPHFEVFTLPFSPGLTLVRKLA